jgi:uncharacterized membrane protein YbhN (UPF0104 family)
LTKVTGQEKTCGSEPKAWSWKKRAAAVASPVFAVGLLTVCAFVLRQQIGKYRLDDVLNALTGIPPGHLALAALFTALSFLILTGYDTLAARYLGYRLPYRKTAVAAFVGYAFCNTVGASLVSGTSVRYYFYSRWGLTVGQISKLVLFCIVTGWVGLLTMSGLVLVVGSERIPNLLAWQAAFERPAGFALLAVVAAYLTLSTVWKKPVRLFRQTMQLPEPKWAVAQFIISCLDWIMISAVVYSLLPSSDDLTYPVVMGMFMIAHSAGSVSQVPGGLGVFEATMLAMITAVTGADMAPRVLGALLAYRAIYYLLPFIASSLLLGTHGLVTFMLWRKGKPLSADPERT